MNLGTFIGFLWGWSGVAGFFILRRMVGHTGPLKRKDIVFMTMSALGGGVTLYIALLLVIIENKDWWEVPLWREKD